MVIAVDFDGTCVTHEYPAIGEDIGAVPVLRELVEAGHKLVLYTVRHGNELNEAVAWFKWHKIPLYGVNSHPDQPTRSPKVFAGLYIDDSAAGCPVKRIDGVKRHFVDWERMREILAGYGLI